MSPPNTKRPQTNADRDFRKPQTPGPGVPVLRETWDEDVTGKHKGEELEALRAQRPPDVRIAHVEKKHDKLKGKVEGLDKKVNEIHGDVREMKGELRTALDFIKAKATAEVAETGRTARTKITTNGKVMIAIATAAIGALVTVLTQVL